MKRTMLIIFLLAVRHQVLAQTKTISLEQCYQWAEENYPLIKQKDIIARTKEYSIDNAKKGFLPQASFLGQATYQSDVTGIPISLPGVEIPQLSKDQYKVYAEVSQTIYDGGAIKMQRQFHEANAMSDQQNITVELYKLRERINQAYFGILLINRQLGLITLRKSDIQSGLDKTKGAIANGTAFKSSADVLAVEILLADQSIIEQKALRKQYLEMLSLFIDQTLDVETTLLLPAAPPRNDTSVGRPELAEFDFRKRIFDVNEKMITVKNQPRINLFVQGGYGKPGLNMLKNEFAIYGLGGIRFSWLLNGFYTSKTDKLLLDNNRRSLDIQKEVFLFNTNLSGSQDRAEIAKLEELIATDSSIVSLRNNIKNVSNAQLENGVKMPSDYVRDVNSENQARQNLVLHEVQLLFAQYKLKTTLGN